MELNKRNIVNRINQLIVTYRVTWDDVVTDLDLAIDEINSYLSTKYPKVSTVLNEFVSVDKTYSYRAGGQNMEFFPEKYFHSIVIPYTIVQILTRDEEFTTIYSKYLSQYQENLFVMARDEMNSIPFQFISAPKGVYFSNPDPAFRQNPEKYFNEKIFMDVPKIRVQYSWGDFRSLLPNGTQSFIEKPLPQDPNAYETGYLFMPVMMYGQNFSTYIVDYNKRVLGIFLGWSLQNNNDPNYIINQPITLLEDTTFYAVFDLDVIGITYNGNGGTIFNWQPTFLSKEEFENSNGNVTPTGGSANRKGYRFVGFKPEKEIIISNDPYAEANDIAPEETLKMNAQWYKMIYKITYVGVLGNFTQTRMNYQYGDEFNLDIPTASEDNPDEFIGWFDNNQFMGDPITKINESDFGDKVFYADYNKEKYRIRWVTEEGFLIKEDYLKKGSLLTTPPTTPKEPVWIDGLLYKFEFVNYFDSRNIAFKDGATKATRNETYIATYTSKIPVTTDIVFQYMETVNDEILSKQYVLDDIQVGSTLDIESDIVRRFVNEDKHIYISSGTPYYMNGIKSLINGLESGTTLLFGSTIQITEQTNYTFACKYGVQGIPVNFKNVELLNGEYGLSDDFNEIIYFAAGTSRETIEEKGATLSFIEHRILNGITTDYLQGFTNLIGDGTTFTEAEFPENLIQELFIMPRYTPQPNTRFLKKLTIVGLPDETSLNLLPPHVEYVDSNKTFDLSVIKDLTETNAYQKLRISEFYEAKVSDVYMNLIQDLDIQVRNDRVVYARTTTKDKIDVIYRRKINASTYEDLKVITFWPYQIQNSIDFFPLENPPENVTNYLGTSYEVQGWTLTDGSIQTEEKIIINSYISGDIILYPVFVRLGKIKVNFNFKTVDNYELLTNFSMNSTLVKELDYTKIGSIQILYNDYESFIRDLNYHSELNLFNDLTSYNETAQQIGYSLISYSSSLGESPQTSMPITLNLNNFQRSNIYDQDYEVTITMRYTRKTSYALLELGGFSKPNGSLSLYQYSNWNASPSQFERRIFVYKGRTYGSLIQDGTIPMLLTRDGDQLNYATYDEINNDALDIEYSSTITNDTKIYINDYTPEEPIFRVIYMGLDWFDNYTIQLKSVPIYPSEIVGGMSFDLLAKQPQIPTYREQDGYQFIGWSVPEEGEGITNSINISSNRVDDFIVQATYVIPGKLNVRFKVIGEAGNELLTNYDLIEDPFGTDVNLYKYSKDMTAYKNQVVGIQINTLLNEFKTAIGENSLAQRGYVAVAGRLDYNGITNLSGQTTYTQTNYVFSFDLRIADSHFYYNDVNLVFYIVLRRVTGYVHAEVLENSVPNSMISTNAGPYRKFFIAWGESITTVRTNFDSNYPSNPIEILQDYDYYTYTTGGGYLLVNSSFQANSTMPQNIKIFIRDDI